MFEYTINIFWREKSNIIRIQFHIIIKSFLLTCSNIIQIKTTQGIKISRFFKEFLKNPFFLESIKTPIIWESWYYIDILQSNNRIAIRTLNKLVGRRHKDSSRLLDRGSTSHRSCIINLRNQVPRVSLRTRNGIFVSSLSSDPVPFPRTYKTQDIASQLYLFHWPTLAKPQTALS